MFDSESQGSTSGCYRVELVSSEFRQKSHQQSVQGVLDEGNARGWRLVSATTDACGAWVTGVWWDTTPDR